MAKHECARRSSPIAHQLSEQPSTQPGTELSARRLLAPNAPASPRWCMPPAPASASSPPVGDASQHHHHPSRRRRYPGMSIVSRGQGTSRSTGAQARLPLQIRPRGALATALALTGRHLVLQPPLRRGDDPSSSTSTPPSTGTPHAAVVPSQPSSGAGPDTGTPGADPPTAAGDLPAPIVEGRQWS